MTEFLVELYLPRGTLSDAEQAAECARAGAEEASCGGPAVRHLQTIFLPADETCFLLYSARSADAAREAAVRSKLCVERVSEAVLSREHQP